jgi:DNA primase
MNFSEQLKGQLNIVEVIGQYVRLKRSGAGANYTGLCPFHSEKTPSFHVHGVNQFYKCFGCDASGDVFKFVMEVESLTFPEVLKLLAERYGIPMPERSRSDDPEARRREAIFEMHEIAAQVFQDNLRGAMGEDARRYLDSRGITAAARDEFRLGLADGSGQQLVNRLQKFGPSALEESGLIGKRTEGPGHYDRFRGRLMFPIHNESGKVIAFGGRALRANDEPKYLNSPETKIYKKSLVLYNLHRAKTEARKQERMVLVEGYMDAIGVYTAGVKEVVASCGTSLTNEQVRAMKRQVSQQRANKGQVILNFDPDAAGVRSTEKYIGMILAEGLRVKVLELPSELDPDEYVKQHGAEAYREKLESASSYFHWLADRTRTKFDMHSAEGRADAFTFMLPSIQQVTDRLERAAITSEMAERLGVDREVIQEQFRRNAQPRTAARPTSLPVAIPPNEKLLLACLLMDENARAAIQHYLKGSGILTQLELKPIFEAALEMEAEDVGFSVDALSRRLESRHQRILMDLSFSDLGMGQESAAQQALHCLQALETKSAEVARNDLKRRIKQLEAEGKMEEALRLMEQLHSGKS